MKPTEYVFKSPAMRVHWLGWESTTHRLASAGWDLSAREDFATDSVSIAIRHPGAGIYGASDNMRYRYRDNHLNQYRYGQSSLDNLTFRMTLAENIMYQTVYEPQLDFHPVDPYPTIEALKSVCMSDLEIFRRLPSRDKDIVVVPPSFDSILQMALDHQAPKQKELREKARQNIKGEQLIRVAA